MTTSPRCAALIVASALQLILSGAAFGQGAADEASTEALQVGPPSPEADRSTGIPVLYVTAVEILHTSTEPKIDIIRVTGLASSKGWSDPQLAPTSARMSSNGILDLELIATPPELSQTADGFVPISAVLVLEPGDPYKEVRVRGSENAVKASAPGVNVAAVTTNDCHDCIGKKLASDPHVAAGQQNVLRPEDFPQGLRIIAPSSGIRSGLLDPNRLTLMVDDDNTITDAFWE